MIQWDNADGAVRAYTVASGRWETHAPPEGFERNDLFLAEMRHFLRLIRGEEVSACSLEEGIWALRLALAVRESDRSGAVIRFGGAREGNSRTEPTVRGM
jgi:predicted dehydrogenase